MKYSSLTSRNSKKTSRFFALVVMISILVPNVYIGNIQTVSAQEASASSVSSESKSDGADSKSEKSSTSANESVSKSDSSEKNKGSKGKSSKRISISSIKDRIIGERDSQGDENNEDSLRGPNPFGSVTICRMIADQNGVIATSAIGLPSAEFSISFRPYVNPPFFFDNVVMQTSQFAPNAAILGPNNDAQCYTRNGVPLSDEGYLYYEEMIDPANEWLVPMYNDQHTVMVEDLTDFFEYSDELFDNDPNNDGFRNVNSDGQVGLTAERPDRIIIVLNRYTSTVQNQPPQLTIVGPNPANITVGQPFTDQGATAWDPEEGNITNRVTATGTVDTTTVGSYTVTYSVTDLGGLTDTETRIVNIIPETIVNYGSFTVCKMIIDNQGHLAKSNTGLPFGRFEVDVTQTEDLSTVVRTAVFDTSTFVPNKKIFTSSITNDAQCITFNDLVIDESSILPSYYYSQERITSNGEAEWGTPGYNDQFTETVTDAAHFHEYTTQLFDLDPANDGLRNINADGHMGLTLERPNRTLVILNRYTPNAGPITGSIEICKMIADSNGQIATSSAGLPNGDFTQRLRSWAVPISYDQNTTWWAQSFAPNTSILSNGVNDAECHTHDNLELLPQGYFYPPEGISPRENWLAPQYYDMDVAGDEITSLSDFGVYDNRRITLPNGDEDEANQDADGWILLTENRPNRRLVVLNTYEAGVPPVNTPPVITLNGDTPITITEGQTYTDPGATATDAEDGDLTNEIVTINEVDANTVGTYMVQYSVTDSGGLSDSKKRVVHVIPRGGGTDFGSVTVCKMIADVNGNIATSSKGLPAGQFGISIGETTDISSSTVGTATFRARTFTPNTTLFGTERNAECVTFNNLEVDNTVQPLGLPSYFYSQETISETDSTSNTQAWRTPLYSDQFTLMVDDLGDLTQYTPQFFDADPSNDDLRNVNSDGHIGLTSERPNRTLVVLNTYNLPIVNPPVNTPPVITVLGDNPLTLVIGNVFTDPGATATDAQDGDLTDEIITTGTSTVDVNTLGDYTVTYTVEDSGGLTDLKTRTVRIVPADDGGNNGGGGGGGSGGRSGGRVLGEQIEPTTCFYLRDHLKQGWQNDVTEVLKLQLFLKTFEGFSNLEATGTFDDATFSAVSAFQIRYFNDILAPWGHDTSTGFVYILTKKKVNEIFCQMAFPVTALEQDEIDNFKIFLDGLRARGIDVNASGDYSTPSDEGTSIKDKIDIKDIISETVGMTDNEEEPDRNMAINMDNIKSLASAIFSLPTDNDQILESIYFLLIAVIAIYLLTEIAVGSMNTENMSKYKIWSRKATGYVAGIAIAVGVALWYNVLSIIAPLLILLAVSVVFFIWATTRKS
jgi:hypothetical protein